ncbi:MAG: hypothetical protein ACFFFK_07575 [Candidatus Thorarchaeota archaeon]
MPTGTDESSVRIRNHAGKVMSKGTALALHEILHLANWKLHVSGSIIVTGSNTEAEVADNQVLIGGPLSNVHTLSMLEILGSTCDLPVSIITQDNHCKLVINNSLRLEPKLDGQNGTDHALIVHAEYCSTPKKYVVLLAGCFMHGTWAAARAATDPRFIQSLSKKLGKSRSNFALVLKVRVINNIPIDFEVDFDGFQHVYLYNKSAHECS